MKNIAIIKNGKVVGQWNVPASAALFDKFTLMCKEIGQKARWADHGVVMKRRLDPSYVILRNNSKQRALLLVDVTDAPTNYLDELSSLYGWSK